MLRFVFLTGITKFSQLSIFSELNNITNVSMHQEYAGICGITKEELLDKFDEDIDVLAGRLGLTHEQALSKLKEIMMAITLPGHHQIFSILIAC